MCARKKDVILNLTKCPCGTVISHVHFMLCGKVCGYSGENSLPDSPVIGMMLSIPWVLHGPMAAEIEKRKKKELLHARACIMKSASQTMVYVECGFFLIYRANFISATTTFTHSPGTEL